MGHLSVSWSNLKSSHGVSHGDVSKLGIPKLTRHCSLDMKPQDFQQRHLGTHPHDLVSHQTQKVHELVVKQQNLFWFPNCSVNVKFFEMLYVQVLVLSSTHTNNLLFVSDWIGPE